MAEKSEKGGREQKSARKQEERQGGEQERQAGPSDLKEREYTDAQGNVHHHTRTYQEQHGKGEKTEEKEEDE
jgi:hypothetical protein